MNFFKNQLQKNDLVAAPMAGISSPPFRKLLREFHSGLVYTEMVSVEGVSRNNPSSTEYLDIIDGGPTVVQLFGGKPDSYREAVKVTENYSNPDAFDVNMGCPVKKVIKTGGGCALLQDLQIIKKIVYTIRDSTEKPFSIKIRVGWDDSKHVYMDILDIAQNYGADAIILHARTKSQMFGGNIHYDALENMASKSSIPVIGNGDVTGYKSYKKVKETGVDGVMIGRGMMHAPWIFKAIKEGRESDFFLSPTDIYDLIMKLYSYMKGYAKNEQNLTHYNNVIKKFSVWFSKGLKDSADFRGEVYKDDTIDRFIALLKFFQNTNNSQIL